MAVPIRLAVRICRGVLAGRVRVGQSCGFQVSRVATTSPCRVSAEMRLDQRLEGEPGVGGEAMRFCRRPVVAIRAERRQPLATRHDRVERLRQELERHGANGVRQTGKCRRPRRPRCRASRRPASRRLGDERIERGGLDLDGVVPLDAGKAGLAPALARQSSASVLTVGVRSLTASRARPIALDTAASHDAHAAIAADHRSAAPRPRRVAAPPPRPGSRARRTRACGCRRGHRRRRRDRPARRTGRRARAASAGVAAPGGRSPAIAPGRPRGRNGSSCRSGARKGATRGHYNRSE